jgi:hypothetical protein
VRDIPRDIGRKIGLVSVGPSLEDVTRVPSETWTIAES